MSSVFGRLQYVFDNDKFGDAINLSDKAKNMLNSAPVTMKTWQKNALANGNIIRTDYYKNPVYNVSSELLLRVNTLANVMNSVINYTALDMGTNAANLMVSVANLEIQIANFIKHTANVSGVTTARGQNYEFSEDVVDYPDYDKAVSLGQQILMITNTTDAVANTTPLLGSMTSLFISNDISNSVNSIWTDSNTINSSLTMIPVDTYTYNSSISVAQVLSIKTNIETANTLLYTRRIHDWNFYRNGRSIVEDYNMLNRMERLGGTQRYLINNMIGTELYKENIAANT